MPMRQFQTSSAKRSASMETIGSSNNSRMFKRHVSHVVTMLQMKPPALPKSDAEVSSIDSDGAFHRSVMAYKPPTASVKELTFKTKKQPILGKNRTSRCASFHVFASTDHPLPPKTTSLLHRLLSSRLSNLVLCMFVTFLSRVCHVFVTSS